MGKDKLKRFAEMEVFSNAIQPTIEEVLNCDYRLKGKWIELEFNNLNPLVLELGCGKGEYTVGLAKSDANKNFIGLDIKGSRMWKGAKEALELKMDNVRFLRTRIDFITSFFGKDEVDEIWITFPDPHLKESRARKRLTHPFFLKRYDQFLKKGGVIHLKTDSAELHEYTLEIINEYGLILLECTNDLYNPETKFNEPGTKEPLLNIQTFYEQMFLKTGKKITYLKFQLNDNHKTF